MAALAWLLIAIPLGSGAVLACVGRRADGLAPTVGLVVSAVTLVLAILAAVARPRAISPLFAGIDGGIAIDGLSAVLAVTVTAVTLVVLLHTAGEFSRDQARARFIGLMLLFSGAMLVTVTANGLALLLMGWEVMGAVSWGLIGYWWRESRRVRAANVAFLTTRTADLGLYLAAGAALAGGVSTLALEDLPNTSPVWSDLVTVGVVLAALGKSAQLPFHFWLSRAMEGPSPVSALLHSATMVAAGAYLLLRLQPQLADSGWAEPLVAWVGALTALVLGLVAVAQTDLKQLLAASTAAQIGFMVLAAGVGSVVGGTLQLVAHAATKSALFLAAGAWLVALGTKSLPALHGSARRYPLVGATFTISAAALAGLPPLSLWITKGEVLSVVLQRSPTLYLIGLAATVISSAYSVKAIWFVWQPAPGAAASDWDTEQQGSRGVHPFQSSALVVLSAAAAVLGLLGLPPVLHALEELMDVSPLTASLTGELVISALLAVGVSAFVWWWGERRVPLPAALQRLLRDWLRVESAAQVLVVRPTMAVARRLEAFDDRVLDRAVMTIPTVGLWLARVVNLRAEIRVDGIVHAVARGTRFLGMLARRPQTGQLHHYYAQVAVGLAVLALFVVLVS